VKSYFVAKGWSETLQRPTSGEIEDEDDEEDTDDDGDFISPYIHHPTYYSLPNYY
jgi:hypothetical protein